MNKVNHSTSTNKTIEKSVPFYQKWIFKIMYQLKKNNISRKSNHATPLSQVEPYYQLDVVPPLPTHENTLKK